MDITESPLSRLSAEEKAALCVGADFWHTAAVKKLLLPALRLSDGPHGLRKPKGRLAMGKSQPATCFPTAVTSACSFDRELLRREGEAIGAEARAQGVSLVLGPGLNIKRHPLCGRNFEYLSEDPCLSGELAAAFVAGVQSRGVGACLKHFACNNQETGRMISDSLVDDRALREIYLAGLETAVKKAQPMAVMGAYNKINGVYACENSFLLADILRGEWGFEGMTVTDWGAMNDVVAAVNAGMDLEMPASGGERTKRLLEAVADGRVSPEALDRAAGAVLRFALTVKDNPPLPVEADAHHELSRRIARESAVLLTNGGVLPFEPAAPTVCILWDEPPCQGAGSSQVCPTEVTTVRQALAERGVNYLLATGRNMDEASIAALAAEQVALFVQLPESEASEGFDRKMPTLPEAQNRLIENVLSLNPRTVIVLSGGGAMELPWADRAGAILYMGLGGQAAAGAAVDLLFGDENPSGHLAETWPQKLSDCPANPSFGAAGPVEYRESVFVGYRYYDTAAKDVLFPFGHGLSYTSFAYSGLTIDPAELTVSLTVTNTGDRPGREAVQLYVAPPRGHIFRPSHELRDFCKVFLEPGEAAAVTFQLTERSFAFWNTKARDWAVAGGEYTLQLGSSSRDIRLEGALTLERPAPDIENFMTNTPAYYAPARGGELAVPRWQFEALLGRPLPREDNAVLSLNSTLADIQDAPEGRALMKLALSFAGNSAMLRETLPQLPLRALAMGGGVKLSALEALVNHLNRRRARQAEPLTPRAMLRRLKERGAQSPLPQAEEKELLPPAEEIPPAEETPSPAETDAVLEGDGALPPEAPAPSKSPRKKWARRPRAKAKASPAEPDEISPPEQDEAVPPEPDEAAPPEPDGEYNQEQDEGK